MSVVIMYSSGGCPYCIRARMLLERKGVAFEDIRVDLQPGLRSEMELKSGRTSVPQIFINGRHVGGYDELYMLDLSGELDKWLAEA